MKKKLKPHLYILKILLLFLNIITCTLIRTFIEKSKTTIKIISWYSSFFRYVLLYLTLFVWSFLLTFTVCWQTHLVQNTSNFGVIYCLDNVHPPQKKNKKQNKLTSSMLVCLVIRFYWFNIWFTDLFRHNLYFFKAWCMYDITCMRTS